MRDSYNIVTKQNSLIAWSYVSYVAGNGNDRRDHIVRPPSFRRSTGGPERRRRREPDGFRRRRDTIGVEVGDDRGFIFFFGRARIEKPLNRPRVRQVRAGRRRTARVRILGGVRRRGGGGDVRTRTDPRQRGKAMGVRLHGLHVVHGVPRIERQVSVGFNGVGARRICCQSARHV